MIKIYALLTFILSLMLVFLPLFCVGERSNNEREEQISTTEKENSDTVKVFLSEENKTITLPEVKYLIGCVASEMPASSENEALKAQAVASLSYYKWIKENADNPKNYDITSSEKINQGYKSDEELKALWGDKFDYYYKRISDAVNEVYPQYLTYKGETALSVYHALSPGKTYSSDEIWEKDIPYLKSVICPGDSLSFELQKEKTFTAEEVTKLLKNEKINIENNKLNLKITEKDKEKRCIKLKLFEKEFERNEIRRIFSLESPFFECEEKDGKLFFKVFGKGHGLGMSQNSADFMARQGSDYKEILLHFYPGCKIQK